MAKKIIVPRSSKKKSAKKKSTKRRAASKKTSGKKVPKKKKTTKKKANTTTKSIGLFFGAGAEIAYGLPSGGQFAIEIFRRSPEEQKQRFRDLLDNLDRSTFYVADFLPPQYFNKRINVFGKPDFTSLLQSSIEYRRSQIVQFLNSFDEHAAATIGQSGIDQDFFEELYEEETDKEYGSSNYQNAIRLNDRLGDENELFSSTYFSALLDVLEINNNAVLLRRCLTSFLQLLVGSCGQRLASDLNEHIFTEAPDNIPIFDDVGGVFQIEISQAGLSALEIILEEPPQELTEESDIFEVAGEICRGTLERLFERCLDYQSLIDSHFRYVYDPKASWAKFTKICIFLNVVRDYILEGLPDEDEARDEMDGYYHDLNVIAQNGLEADTVGTTNYNNLLQLICGEEAPKVFHLNGSVEDYYDPYLNQIVNLDDPEEEYSTSDHVIVPMLFTQSGIKPLTSIEMSRRYVDLFDDFKECDAVVVIGFGFQGDDGHINGLFRELIQAEEQQVYICKYAPNGFNEAQVRNEYRRKLRLEQDPDNLHFIPVDGDRMTEDGVLWYEFLAEVL